MESEFAASRQGSNAISDKLGSMKTHPALSGKYRGPADLAQSARGEDVEKYLGPRGFAMLDAVAEGHGAKPAEMALAWLLAQPGVAAPIASATRIAHVASFARAVELVLSPGDLAALNL